MTKCKLLPNGLSQEQVDARPEPYVGMICWRREPVAHWEGLFAPGWSYLGQSALALLPGEDGCPWPPPPQMEHEYQEHDEAWVLLRGVLDEFGEVVDQWIKCVVELGHDEPLFTYATHYGHHEWFPVDTPALYIPDDA
jgi:hypothetical protein